MCILFWILFKKIKNKYVKKQYIYSEKKKYIYSEKKQYIYSEHIQRHDNFVEKKCDLKIWSFGIIF